MTHLFIGPDPVGNFEAVAGICGRQVERPHVEFSPEELKPGSKVDLDSIRGLCGKCKRAFAGLAGQNQQACVEFLYVIGTREREAA